MKLKSNIRSIIILLLIGIFMFGLTSCKLPASVGPQSTSESSEGFPVPGETKPTAGGIDVSTLATQTSQANPSAVTSPQAPSNTPSNQIPSSPVATSVPGTPAPTSTPLVYVQPTLGAPPATYTLEEGEYPFCIARRFDVNQAELLTLNGLTPDSFFYAGQELKIPQTGNPFDGSRTLHDHPSTYKIQSGDTLYSIACYFGDVSPDMIALQNTLSTYDLPIGEVLIIP